jgi:hypothetical protein
MLRRVAHPTPISDPSDERLADYAALTDAALRKRYEHEHGVLIAEGPNVVRELVASRYPSGRCSIAEERLERDGGRARPGRGAGLRRRPRGALRGGAVPAAPGGDRLRGTAARSRTPTRCSPDARTRRGPRGLNDHENLGTLFRSARGLGVDAVLLAPGCADPLYRRSVRVSMGHVLHVPFTGVGALERARCPTSTERGFATVAMTPRADAVDLVACDPPRGPGRHPARSGGARPVRGRYRRRQPRRPDHDARGRGLAERGGGRRDRVPYGLRA